MVGERLQRPLVVLLLLAVVGPDEAVDQVLAQYLVEGGLGVAASLGASASASPLAVASSAVAAAPAFLLGHW